MHERDGNGNHVNFDQDRTYRYRNSKREVRKDEENEGGEEEREREKRGEETKERRRQGERGRLRPEAAR